MIVVAPPSKSEWLEASHESGPAVFSGGPGGLGEPPYEALVTPRRIGFAREPFYIPVYWEGECP